MPDPRTNLSRDFSCLNKTQSQVSDRRNFFKAVGKVGDIEALNRGATAKISQGLRTLASISDTIRTGCGSLPTSIGSAIGQGLDAGVGWVLDNVGIARSAIDAVNRFNPGIANQALGQAQAIFQKVKQGNFKPSDIPGALQNLQNLERLARRIYTPGDTSQTKLVVPCEPSPYAMELISRAPKHKFMFVAQIIFNESYQELANLDIAFLVKTMSRPTIKYHAEEANFYNFRAKVVARTEFNDIQMTFYDDMRNMAGAFYAAYTRATVPITNYPTSNMTFDFENEGMNFESGDGAGDVDSFAIAGTTDAPVGARFPVNKRAASYAGLAGNSKTIMREIRLFHLYDGGRLMNVYTFYNPYITEFSLDDLDMTASDVTTEVKFTFNYDSVYVNTSIPFIDNFFAEAAAAASAGSGQNGAAVSLRYVDVAKAQQGPNIAGIGTFTSPHNPANNCDLQTNTSNPPT